ncbi:MAG: XdhC/CoxI family protein [Coprothermobacterota bacterium]|nr:XdhC/CoxI family protein [Coprothermobacterota bacterium]
MKESQDIFKEIVRLRQAGEDAVLATVVNTEASSPGRVSFKMLVYPDGHIQGTVGGGLLEANVIVEAKRALADRRPRLLHLKLTETDADGIGVLCGGEAEVYLEPVGAPPFLYLFGGGHIGLAIAAKVTDLDFRLVVLDDREEFANRQRFPEADQVLAGPYSRLLGSVETPGIRFTSSDSVVIVTRGHLADEVVLDEVLKRDPQPGYVGMIGSRSKVAVVLQHLRDSGIPQDRLDRVHSPIGLHIGGERPSEIAISILAELIAHRHGKLTPKPPTLPSV